MCKIFMLKVMKLLEKAKDSPNAFVKEKNI